MPESLTGNAVGLMNVDRTATKRDVRASTRTASRGRASHRQQKEGLT